MIVDLEKLISKDEVLDKAALTCHSLLSHPFIKLPLHLLLFLNAFKCLRSLPCLLACHFHILFFAENTTFYDICQCTVSANQICVLAALALILTHRNILLLTHQAFELNIGWDLRLIFRIWYYLMRVLVAIIRGLCVLMDELTVHNFDTRIVYQILIIIWFTRFAFIMELFCHHSLLHRRSFLNFNDFCDFSIKCSFCIF